MAPRRSRWAIVLIAIVLVVIALVLGAWAWLSAWAPVRGKQWLQTQLQRQLNHDVAIGTVRVALWQGLLLQDVVVRDRISRVVWLDAEQLRVRINPLLLLQQRVAFRLGGTLRAPCATDVSLAGRYNLQDRQLAVDLVTADLPIDHIRPPLAQYVPKELKDGVLEVTATLQRPADQPMNITARIVGHHVVWQRDALRVTGPLTIDGQVVATPQGSAPWILEATAMIQDAVAEGLPVFGRTDHVSGTLHWEGRGIDLKELHGDVFGSRWQMEGRIDPGPSGTIDLVLHAPLDLAQAAAGVDALRTWRPTGSAQVAAVCRGPLARWPELDIMLDADVADGALQPPLPFPPVHAIQGRLHYDHLARRLTIDALTGRLQDDPITLRGQARLIQPAELDLQVEAKTDLARVQPWLPNDGPRMRGPASLRVTLTGTSAAPTWDGDLALENAAVAWPTVSIDQLRGSIQFDREQVATKQLLMIVAGEPVRLSGTVKEFRQPNLALAAQFPRGSLALNAKAWDDRVQIERCEAAVGQSRVHAQGTIARPPNTQSRLSASGVIDAADLTSLPWIKLPSLASWQLAGIASVQATMEGDLRHQESWHSTATISADRFGVGGFTLSDVRADFEQRREQLTLRVANSVVANGHLTGSLALVSKSGGPDVALDADLVHADLAQLAQTIPAWKSLGISGDVSTRATLSGSWPRQDTYQGQGWIHATGDHLGELPLLDRVLRGSLGAIADRLGLSTMRKAQLTELAGQWQLARSRVSTQDLRLNGMSGTEPIIIYVQGSVGLDRTLDLTVTPELSEQVIMQAPNTANLSKAETFSSTLLRGVGWLDRFRRLVGRHHLGGTIDKPQYSFEFGVDELLSQVLPFGRLLEPSPGTR